MSKDTSLNRAPVFSTVLRAVWEALASTGSAEQNSREGLELFFRTIEIMGGILFVSVAEGFLLQQWRALEFWVILPNFCLLAFLSVVMWRRYVRYLKAYMRESRLQNPSLHWYQRLRYNPDGQTKPHLTLGTLVLGLIAALTWILVVIAHSR